MMKKSRILLSTLLAVILALTSLGMVLADDAPPPIDNQTLPPPTNLNEPSGKVYYASALLFNWDEVVGADKYKIEIQKSDATQTEYKNFKTLTIASTYPVPPTTATVTSLKPFNGAYRWRITAINTDVGIDAGGTGQTSAWEEFTVIPMSIDDMYPGDYSGLIDPKKGDGTGIASPSLNWIVLNGGSSKAKLSANTTLQFIVTVKQGTIKATYPAIAGDICVNKGSDALCSLNPGTISGLSAGLPYSWEVYAQDKPDPAFGKYIPVVPAGKDTMQYNAYPILTGVVTETMFTNKPTFKWNNATLPTGGKYQLVFMKSDLKNGTSYKWASAGLVTVIPGVTKNPVTKALVCAATGGDCYYTFAAPFKPNFIYRWNLRVLVGTKYGPWANPGTAADYDDMVQYSINGDDDYFNSFFGLTKPSKPEISNPTYNMVTDETFPSFGWSISQYKEILDYSTSSGYGGVNHNANYKFELKRVSPNPLTRTINISTNLTTFTSGPGGTFATALDAAVPLTYTTYGLPRGVYEMLIYPVVKGDGQTAVFSPVVKSLPTKFMIGPTPPSLISIDLAKFPNGHVTYNATTKIMNVIFDKPGVPTNMKYRVLVAMKMNTIWRWVKINTFAGKTCTTGSVTCTLEFPVYKPGATGVALENGTYRVFIQAAMKDEGNGSAVKDAKFGPFGPLSTAWEEVLPTP